MEPSTYRARASATRAMQHSSTTMAVFLVLLGLAIITANAGTGGGSTISRTISRGSTMPSSSIGASVVGAINWVAIFVGVANWVAIFISLACCTILVLVMRHFF